MSAAGTVDAHRVRELILDLVRCYSPTSAEFLGWSNPTWAVWRDFICNGADNVYFEEVGGVAYVTWLNVVG